ncbi:MAG: phosphoenolpyruvate carboxylase, partial [bacterium]|nr:phosphoenolpyruvate carboxylase [bacterium]
MAPSSRSVHFSPDDEPLREDVGVLGRLLGEILIEQGGHVFFDRVEQVRRAAIDRRECDGPLDELVASLAGMAGGSASELVRAFSAYFSLTNLAEQVHRIRRRRDYLMTSGSPQRASFQAVIERLAEAGLNLEQVRRVLEATELAPVFTAHPTQAIRRTVLSKEKRIARALVDRIEHPVRTPWEERRMLQRVRTEATLVWQTKEQPMLRPSVADEAEGVLFILTDVVYKVVPAFYEALRDALETQWGAGAGDGLRGPKLSFGSWVGGDMDG